MDNGVVIEVEPARFEEMVAEALDGLRRTVVHEVAHHFGIDDARLHELGW